MTMASVGCGIPLTMMTRNVGNSDVAASVVNPKKRGLPSADVRSITVMGADSTGHSLAAHGKGILLPLKGITSARVLPPKGSTNPSAMSPNKTRSSSGIIRPATLALVSWIENHERLPQKKSGCNLTSAEVEEASKYERLRYHCKCRADNKPLPGDELVQRLQERSNQDPGWIASDAMARRDMTATCQTAGVAGGVAGAVAGAVAKKNMQFDSFQKKLVPWVKRQGRWPARSHKDANENALAKTLQRLNRVVDALPDEVHETLQRLHAYVRRSYFAERNKLVPAPDASCFIRIRRNRRSTAGNEVGQIATVGSAGTRSIGIIRICRGMRLKP